MVTPWSSTMAAWTFRPWVTPSKKRASGIFHWYPWAKPPKMHWRTHGWLHGAHHGLSMNRNRPLNRNRPWGIYICHGVCSWWHAMVYVYGGVDSIPMTRPMGGSMDTPVECPWVSYGKCHDSMIPYSMGQTMGLENPMVYPMEYPNPWCTPKHNPWCNPRMVKSMVCPTVCCM